MCKDAANVATNPKTWILDTNGSIETRKYAVITNPMREILETSKWRESLLKLIENRKECARTLLT